MPNELWVDIDRYQTCTNPPPGTEKTWHKIQKFCSHSNPEATKLRKFVRSGIPDDLRCIVYGAILGIEQMPPYEKNFQLALQRTYGGHTPDQTLAPTFGGRSHLSSVALNKSGAWVVDHILCIIAHDYPNIEYCPFIPPLVTLLAHHLRTPDELLGGIVSMLKKSLMCPADSKDRWAFFPTFRKSQRELNNAFLVVLSAQNKALAKQLKETYTTQGDQIWDRWFTDFFIKVLPQQAIWRMLDVFILEGYKTFIRFGVALLQSHAPQILKTKPSPGALYEYFSKAFSDDCDVDMICKSAFLVSFSNADIAKKNSSAASVDDLHEAQYKFQRGQPKLKSDSTIIKELHWILLWSWIPPRLRLSEVELLFTTNENGYNLGTMYEMTKEHNQLIIAIETTDGSIFGAYLSGGLSIPDESHSFHGDGETMLFTLEPFGKMYQWAHRDSETSNADSSLFVLATKKDLTIGGGSTPGLWLNDMLTSGSTAQCSTFQNEPLTGNKIVKFETVSLEVFGFI